MMQQTHMGTYVRITHYVDANRLHNQLTSYYITGILHLVNKAPVCWYSNKQSTVETATYSYWFFCLYMWVKYYLFE